MFQFIFPLIAIAFKSLIAFTLLAGVLIFLALVYIIRKRARYAHIPGPPLKQFLLGNVVDLQKNVNNFEYHLKWAREYGPLYKFQVAHKVLLFATTPELARQLLNNSSSYRKSEELYGPIGFVFSQRFIGSGLATELNMTKWRQRRKPLDPAFHKAFLGTNLNRAFNEVADNLVEKLRENVGGKEIVKMSELFKFVTIQAIAKVAFSFDVELIGEGSEAFTSSFSKTMEAMSPFRQNPLYPYLPWNRGFVRDARSSAAFVRKVCLDVLNKRLEAINLGVDVPEDMLTMMVNGWLAQPPQSRATVDEMLDDMLTLFLAGNETTANTLAFMFLLLGKHPKALRKVIEEVDEVVADKKTIDAEDLVRLQYIDALIKETLRIFPIAGISAREVTKGSELAGYKIPEKTSVLVSFFPIQRDHVPFGDQFLPERFLQSDHPGAPPLYTFLAFSMGQRSCIGRHFAIQETKIIVAKLFQNFRFDLPELEQIEVEEHTTFSPINDVSCRVYARQK